MAQQRDELVRQHADLVKRIAHHLKGRLPANVQVDDLIQAGMIGLLEALKNYDNAKGAAFETYAGIRIRGAMLDELRRGDWSPRSVHQQSRKVSEAIQRVEQETGRDALDSEVASKLDMSVTDYHHLIATLNTGKIVGIEDLGVSEDAVRVESQDDDDSTPFHDISREQFQKALSEAIKTLPEREALVLSLYYDDELNLREIGDVLEVSESRVCQIHSQAMHRLKARLKSWQD
ncbi:RNA polymerase sigma factor FliA [Echinimonas agarilytica]|uniref:RNA polymerase sigma factor FliA n=2 Tax=Echinimonas agarilytica TaxID=1215918 RepID=A0AA42B6P7_9GAMM|nr:RNA polymerase sigma factor FliA [Echinimonas agarilytica]MCM2678984.1 RNA polymerase sigma factor FliA [Echinimonas agarilytica]